MPRIIFRRRNTYTLANALLYLAVMALVCGGAVALCALLGD